MNKAAAGEREAFEAWWAANKHRLIGDLCAPKFVADVVWQAALHHAGRPDVGAQLLRELVALVRGECPSLLNEDSGGDARLSIAIDEYLESQHG